MKQYIAVPYKDGEVFQHFGHAPAFRIYETEGNVILKSEEVIPHGGGHGIVTDVLTVSGATMVICGGIGAGAMEALAGKGIEIFSGVEGNAETRVQEYLDGTLTHETGATCKKNEAEHACGGKHEGHGEHHTHAEHKH